MRKFLRFSLVMLLLTVCNTLYATEAIVEFTELTITATNDGFTLSSTPFNFEAVKNTGSSKPTKNGTSNDIRLYAKNSLEISGPSLTKIVFNISTQGLKRWAEITPSTGKITHKVDEKTITWEKSADSPEVTSLTLTVGDKAVHGTDGESKAGQFCFNTATITYEATTGTTVSAPTITGETPFENSTTVTLTAEEGASIYYTTDDSDPTTASTPYSSPFTLNESATVKAIAVKDGKTSSIASKEFTKVTFTGATIADLNEYTDDKAYINLTLTNAKVVYVDGKNIHLRENGKALMMYATNMTGLTLNATVSGTIKVDYDNYNGIHEVKDNTFTNTENLTIYASSSEELDATETTISALLNKEHISDLVVIKNVSITTPDNSKYYVSDGTNEIQLWGNVEISKASVGKTTDVYALYNTIYQGTTPEIKPVSIDGVTTGINKVEVSKSDSKLYNTAGQRVDSAYKGIVIKNGKKVLVK